MNYEIQTKCLYGNTPFSPSDHLGSISYPIYQTATFARESVGSGSGYDYSRLQNPTREHLETIICSLENGFDALAFSSGMSAIATLMELFSPGDHIIAGNDLYGGSIRLFQHINSKNLLKFDFVDTSNEDISPYIRPETKAIYIETPTNPMMNVTDIAKIAEIASTHHLLLIVDNTFLSPYFQNPLDLGAHIVIHSGTKFLGGHNDTLAGFLIVKDEDLSKKLRFIYKTTGSVLAPFDSWLILRGIKTLPLRMEQQEKNAIEIANWLCTHPLISSVFYPGLSTHPGYSICKKQSRGFGSMITFTVPTKEIALTILSSLHIIHFAESLGGVETLITYPITQTHADVSDEDRSKTGITETTLRISIGVEHVKDLIQDLSEAFKIAYTIET